METKMARKQNFPKKCPNAIDADEIPSLWIILAIFRIFSTVFGQYGYIHPDEWFQTIEPVAGDVLGVEVLYTWEFDTPALRSMLLPHLLYGFPFWILSHLDKHGFVYLNAHIVFLLPRIILMTMTLIIEILIFTQLKQCVPNREASRALLLFSSSYISFIFYGRAFSNTMESFLFITLILLCMRERINGHVFLLALNIIIGFFNRPTYGLYAFIPVFYIWSKKSLINLKFVITLLIMTFMFISYDSYYYSHLTITPLNFIIYNIRAKNLANHGIHPHYLHLINMFMLFGPLLIKIRLKTRWLVLSTVIPLVTLSCFPHQEPRFIIPLLFPLCLLASKTAIRTPWIVLWITFNLVNSIIFGIVHQGGIVPCLKVLQNLQTAENGSTYLIFYHTYMPPRHLLLENRDIGRKVVVDMQGTSLAVLEEKLLSIGQASKILLVAPGSVSKSLESSLNCSYHGITYFFPHLSTEDMPYVNFGSNDWLRSLFNQLSLKIYKPVCL